MAQRTFNRQKTQTFMTHKQNVKRLASIVELVQSKIGPADEPVRGLIEMILTGRALTGQEDYDLMRFSLEDGSAPWARVAWVARMVDNDLGETDDADVVYTGTALQLLEESLDLKLK